MLTRTLPGDPGLGLQSCYKSSPGWDSPIGSQICVVILRALIESHTDEKTMRERGSQKEKKNDNEKESRENKKEKRQKDYGN